MTTNELKSRLEEIKKGFSAGKIFFGSAEAEEMMRIEIELIKRGEMYATFYSED